MGKVPRTDIDMKQLQIPLLCLAAGLGSALVGGGCAAAAVAASTLVISDEFQSNAQAAQFPTTPELAWKSTLHSLSQMTGSLIHRDDDLRVAETRVDYGVVTVQVREVSAGTTEVRVYGEKALLYSPELSRLVLDKIELDLNHFRKPGMNVAGGASTIDSMVQRRNEREAAAREAASQR